MVRELEKVMDLLGAKVPPMSIYRYIYVYMYPYIYMCIFIYVYIYTYIDICLMFHRNQKHILDVYLMGSQATF